MKFQLPQEPNKSLLDDSRFEWINRLWRHIRGDSDWIELTLQNGWVNYGGSYYNASYRIKNGIVYIEGLLKSGTTTGSTVMFNLPEGYRPLSRIIVTNVSYSAIGRFDVQANGDVSFHLGSNVWFPIHCSFVAEQ